MLGVLLNLLMLIFLSFCEASSIKCNQKGLCLGHLIEVQESIPNQREFNSITDCVHKCKEVSGCKFASFNSNHETCTLSKACHTVVLMDSNYTHSSVNCEFKILIQGGKNDPNPIFETLSLKGDDSCEISNGVMSNPTASTAIGLMNAFPTICGGYYSGIETKDQCYQYNNARNEFVQSVKLQTGVDRAGFTQYHDSFIITGGYDNEDRRVNLAQIAGETETWTMPVTIALHCMIQINDTSYILIGGIQDGYPDKRTFIFSPKENGTKFYRISVFILNSLCIF